MTIFLVIVVGIIIFIVLNVVLGMVLTLHFRKWVFLFEWNNSGGSKYPMIAAKQVSTVSQYNKFIQEYGLDKLEDDATFLLDF